MKHDNLKLRTRRFALDVIRFYRTLGGDFAAQHLGKQLLRAATSVGANYRAACRAKSPADFIHRLGTVEEEADECGFWLDCLIEESLTREAEAGRLKQEAEELTAIMVSSANTTRGGSRPTGPRSIPHSALRTPHLEAQP